MDETSISEEMQWWKREKDLNSVGYNFLKKSKIYDKYKPVEYKMLPVQKFEFTQEEDELSDFGGDSMYDKSYNGGASNMYRAPQATNH